MRTTLAKKGEISRQWYEIDASGQVLGRLAVKVANLLRGRHKVTYTPNVDTGDFVIITNAEKVVVTGKKESRKQYMFYTGYMGNEKYRSLSNLRKKKPTFIVEHAIRGMLPKNKLAREMLKKLKVHSGPEHSYQAQNPKLLNISCSI